MYNLLMRVPVLSVIFAVFPSPLWATGDTMDGQRQWNPPVVLVYEGSMGYHEAPDITEAEWRSLSKDLRESLLACALKYRQRNIGYVSTHGIRDGDSFDVRVSVRFAATGSTPVSAFVANTKNTYVQKTLPMDCAEEVQDTVARWYSNITQRYRHGDFDLGFTIQVMDDAMVNGEWIERHSRPKSVFK